MLESCKLFYNVCTKWQVNSLAEYITVNIGSKTYKKYHLGAIEELDNRVDKHDVYSDGGP